MNDDLERRLRDAISAETGDIPVDEHASLAAIRERGASARRRRLVGATALGAAAALVIGIAIGASVGGDDDHTNVAANGPRTTIGGDCASTTTGPVTTYEATTGTTSEVVAGNGTSSIVTDPPSTSVPPTEPGLGDGCQDTVPPSSQAPTTPSSVTVPTTTVPVQQAYAYPLADDTRSAAERTDPVATARTFLTVVIGITDPALGPFVPTDTDRGTVALFNGHGEPQPGAVQRSSIIVARRATGDWVVVGANSDAISISKIGTEPKGSSLSVRVSGTGRGFEGVLHVLVVGGGDASGGTTMASGGMDLTPFETTEVLRGQPSSIGVIVSNDSGEVGGAVDVAARAVDVP